MATVLLCQLPLEFTLACSESNLQMMGNNVIPLKVSRTTLNYTRQRFFKQCPVLVVSHAVKAAVISYTGVKCENKSGCKIYNLSGCTLLIRIACKKPQSPQNHDLVCLKAMSGLRNLKLKVQVKHNTVSHGCNKSAQTFLPLYTFPLFKIRFYLFAPSAVLSLG